MSVTRRPQKQPEKSPTRKLEVVKTRPSEITQKEALSLHDKATAPFETSQSMIKTWRRCRNKYYYRFVELLELRRPKLQLIRGTMIGKCLDLIALHRNDKKTPAWQTALKPYRKEYGRLFAEEQEMYGDPIGEVERIVERYERIYAKDGFTYLAPTFRTGRKDPFELPVRVDISPGIIFTGHLDKMPEDKQGRVWDMDHKSHKRIPEPEDRLNDLQQVLYQWAGPQSGYPKLAGVIWDYIRTKAPAVPELLKKGGLTRRQNIDTDHETYLSAIVSHDLKPQDYAEELNRLKPRGYIDFYQRVQLPNPNKEMVNRVVADAQASSIEMKRSGGHDRTRSLDWTCKSCEYRSLCQAELRGVDAEFIRKSEFQRQKDPRHIHLLEEDI